MTAICVMLMNYFHDLATGLLFGGVVAYLVALRVLTTARDPGEGARLSADLYARWRPWVLGALIAILAGGVPRAYFYRDYEWLPAAGRGQVVALGVKHVALVTVTAAALLAFFRSRPDRRNARG